MEKIQKKTGAAIHLMQNQLGDGNVNKLVQKMVKHGLLQKDQSVKKQTLYRPFLKDCRNGYFVARFDSSNDPIPVIQSNIVLTLDGLNWLTAEFQKIAGVEYVQHRPLIQHSPYTKYRLSLVNQMEPVLQ